MKLNLRALLALLLIVFLVGLGSCLGGLLMTDKFPETILAFAAMP